MKGLNVLSRKEPTTAQLRRETIGRVILNYREIFFSICPDFFVTGSYRFNCVTDNSDLDLVFPIMARDQVLAIIPKLGVREIKQSNYNAGVKFIAPGHAMNQIINCIFLHPSEFVSWSKAAKMLEVSGILSMDKSPVERPLRHAIHQTLVAMANAALSDVVDAQNYTEFL